jgi:hypothetical protein
MSEQQAMYQNRQYGGIFKSRKKRDAIPPLAKASGLLARDSMKLQFRLNVICTTLEKN